MRLNELFDRFLRLDRRILYALVLLCVTFPFYVRWPKVEVQVSREVEAAFQLIDSIPPHSKPLLLSIDYDPASAAELTPAATAVLRHCFRRGVPVLVISLQITGQGAGVASELVPRIAAEYGRKKNVDWAFLGFQPSSYMTILQMGESIPETFPRDYFGTPVNEIPLMQSIQNYDQIAAVVTCSSTIIGENWIIYGGTRYGVSIVAALTAVYVADVQPYLQNGQLKGLIGGLKGAAEYEKRIGCPGDGAKGMPSQKLAHYLMIAFIVMGNIAYLSTRKRRRP